MANSNFPPLVFVYIFHLGHCATDKTTTSTSNIKDSNSNSKTTNISV